MFEDTLLESSAARSPVLRREQWLVSLLVGALGFAAASLALPVAAGPAAERILLLRAGAMGEALAAYALAACYTFSDARRKELHAGRWLAVVLLMNMPGFLVYLVYSAFKTGDWKRAALPIAYAFEAVLIGAAALVPLICTQALPSSLHWVNPIPPVPAGRPVAARAVRTNTRTSSTDVWTAPREIPNRIPTITDEVEATPEPAPAILGIPEGLGGSGDSVFGLIMPVTPVPAAPQPRPKPATAQRISLGGRVEAAKLVFAPKPDYPPLALAARAQGTVKMQAIIATDGTIQELKVLSGNPLLVGAARDAVARWRYQPTLLNGEAVEVLTEIEVTFRLND